jgi:hypothetical protein
MEQSVGHVERRPTCFVVRRVGRGRSGRTIKETVKKYLETNELDINMVYDTTVVPKYKTPLTKSRDLRKLIVIINLLIVEVEVVFYNIIL